MSTKAQEAKDDHTPIQMPSVSTAERPITLWGSLFSPILAMVITLLSPLGIFAPRWFARRFAAQRAVIPLFLAILLAATWNIVRLQSTRFMAAMLLLGALGLVGMWAVATMMTVSLAGRWEESQKAASYKAGSLVFSFAGGFCLLLLLLYWFGMDAVQQFIIPRLKGDMLAMSFAYLGLLMIGLGLSVIAPIQIFRGLTSVGGGAMPNLEPICRDCGYSLEGVAESYRANRYGLAVDAAAPNVCSECGCELAASLDDNIRPGTTWTRGQRISLGAWLRTLWTILREPGEFFATLPIDSSREAAVRFWSYNLLAVLAMVAGLFAVNHWVFARWHLGMPLPITAYESASIYTAASMNLWLPATLIGATMVMYAVVMAGSLVLCGSAEFVWQRVGMLRGRNMHPAGLFMVCYLSGHVLLILMAATAAFLAARLAIRALPPDQTLAPWLTYEHIMGIRTWAGGIAVGAGLLVTGAGALWYRKVVTQAGRMMQYANS